MTKLCLIAALAAALMSGCGLLPDQATRLWTDSLEIAVYVEEYNGADHPYRVELEFLANPARELAIRTDHPDVVVARQLTSRTVRPFLQDLTSLLEMPAVPPDRFYQELLALGEVGEEQLALPVSFNLPLVMFDRDSGLVEPERFGLTPMELRQIAAAYNESIGAGFVRMGLSPRWDTRFLVATAALNGAEFRETAPHQVSWDSAALEAAVAGLRVWVTESNGGGDLEDAFRNRYLYDPFLKLLETRRIGSVYATSDEFFAIAESRRNELTFGWLWNGSKIPVLGTVLYAGLPSGVSNRRGAEHFLRWLFDPEVQGELVRSAPRKRIRSFGFAGGFSAVPEVNTDHIALRYRALLGAVPQEERLAFPNVLPTYWDELSSEVLEPWMSRVVRSEDAAAPLSQLVDAWLLTRGE